MSVTTGDCEKPISHDITEAKAMQYAHAYLHDTAAQLYK